MRPGVSSPRLWECRLMLQPPDPIDDDTGHYTLNWGCLIVLCVAFALDGLLAIFVLWIIKHHS